MSTAPPTPLHGDRPFTHTTFADFARHYADCGWIFAQHFCNRLGQAYLALKNILDEANPTHASVLNDIKRRFREETFTRESIAQVIHGHAELVCCS